MNIQITIGEKDVALGSWLFQKASELYSYVSGPKVCGKIVIIGPAEAGRISYARIIRSAATEDELIDEVTLKNGRVYQLHHLPNVTNVPVWQHGDADAVIYVFDSSDTSTIFEIKKDSQNVIELFRKAPHVPILYINSSGTLRGVSNQLLLESLGIQPTETSSLVNYCENPVTLYSVNINTLDGIDDSLAWLTNCLS